MNHMIKMYEKLIKEKEKEISELMNDETLSTDEAQIQFNSLKRDIEYYKEKIETQKRI